jgi:diguanylate cyclase (GGDEF)-like protein/PAS domain S-box-containing protein
MNIFIAVAFLTSVISLSFIIISLYHKAFMEANFSFILLSALVFLNSIFVIMTINSSNPQAALGWSYFQEIITLLYPIFFFDFINIFLGNNLPKARLIYRLIPFILPLGIFIYLIANESIEVKKYYFGYMPYYDEQFFIGVFYLVPVYLLISVIIFRKVYKNHREKRINRTNIFIAVVFSCFLLMNVIYRPITMSGIMEVIPISVILNFVLFLLVTIALLNSRFNVMNMTFRRIFENVGDCIMVTNDEGKVIELNRCLFEKMFYLKDVKFSDDKDKVIKEKLLNFSKNKKDFKVFLRILESSMVKNFRKDLHFKIDGSEKIFDVIMAPINDRGGNLIGKSTIFRDVTTQRLYEAELWNHSWIDYLTGAYNTRYIFERLKEEIKRYERYKEPFCILLMDIDNFKKYNDTFGHIDGDKLLKDVVGLFKDNIRERIDVVGRYGGDEFIVILSRIGIEEARDMSERILRHFNRKEIEFISLSIGVYEYNGEKDIDELLRKVDSLMYKAKKSGGNRLAYN